MCYFDKRSRHYHGAEAGEPRQGVFLYISGAGDLQAGHCPGVGYEYAHGHAERELPVGKRAGGKAGPV